MRKAVFLLALLLVFCVFSGCENEKTPESQGVNGGYFYESNSSNEQENEGTLVPDSNTFTGVVLAVEKGMILVSPDEENSAISPQVYVNISRFSDMSFEVGDRIEVTFNGQVAQSFPPQILGVIDINRR